MWYSFALLVAAAFVFGYVTNSLWAFLVPAVLCVAIGLPRHGVGIETSPWLVGLAIGGLMAGSVSAGILTRRCVRSLSRQNARTDFPVENPERKPIGFSTANDHELP